MQRGLLTFLVACLFVNNLKGQFRPNRYLYVTGKEHYVLSEKTKLNEGENQTFNSLFIWQKDKVIRIIFKYLKTVSKVNNGYAKRQSFDNFIPPFKKYIVIPSRSRTTGILDTVPYAGKILYLGGYENNADHYTTLLKLSINNWNSNHNPLADKLGVYVVSDGNPYLLIRNKRRKQEYTDNLPLVLDAAKGDSLILIQPYVINVYKIDEHSGITSKDVHVESYKLYSTIWLLEDSFPDVYSETGGVGLQSFIEEHTLPWLHKLIISSDQSPISKTLAAFPLADEKFTAPGGYTLQMEKTTLHRIGDPKVVNALLKRDSVSRAEADSIEKIYENDCFGYFQYCPQCYNNSVTKEERITMHCPFKVREEKPADAENWSFALLYEGRNFFKVELPKLFYSNGPVEEIRPGEYHYLTHWLLMSPGIGFWMTDVAGDSRKYQMPNDGNFYFYLDSKPAFAQSP